MYTKEYIEKLLQEGREAAKKKREQKREISRNWARRNREVIRKRYQEKKAHIIAMRLAALLPPPVIKKNSLPKETVEFKIEHKKIVYSFD
jgi:hypothetical protein